jgi:hypothetical protein
VYSPRNSTTAAAGQYASKNQWDASSPADAQPGCNTTSIPLAGGPPTSTCAFNQTYRGTWEKGGVVTDQLRFEAGLSGFNTWQTVDIRAVFGAMTWVPGAALSALFAAQTPPARLATTHARIAPGMPACQLAQHAPARSHHPIPTPTPPPPTHTHTHTCRDASELGPVCTFPWAICGANQGPASLQRQVAALAPAGVDPGLGLCLEAPSQWQGKPNGTDSFLTLGGGLPGGEHLVFSTSPLQPGGIANNSQQYGYWVGLRGVRVGAGGAGASVAFSGNTTALVDSGSAWLGLPPAAMQLYAAKVQEIVVASTGLQMVKVRAAAGRVPALTEFHFGCET